MYLLMTSGIFFSANSFMAILKGSVSPSKSTNTGAFIDICSALVPRILALSYLVIYGVVVLSSLGIAFSFKVFLLVCSLLPNSSPVIPLATMPSPFSALGPSPCGSSSPPPAPSLPLTSLKLSSSEKCSTSKSSKFSLPPSLKLYYCHKTLSLVKESPKMTNITQICWEKDNIRFLVIRHDESIDENEFSTGSDSKVNYFSAFAVRHFFKLFFFHELVMMKKKKKSIISNVMKFQQFRLISSTNKGY